MSDSSKLSFDDIKQFYQKELGRKIKDNEFVADELVSDVAKKGKLNFLIFFHKLGCTFTTDAMDYAASRGHLDVVKWLHENRKEGCTTNAMDNAAGHGRLDVVAYLHENGYGCTTDAMDWAANDGHLDMVKWLHENRTEGCTTWAMNGAAGNGYLDVVKFLYEKRTEGCIREARQWALSRYYLDVVNYLKGNENLSVSVQQEVY